MTIYYYNKKAQKARDRKHIVIGINHVLKHFREANLISTDVRYASDAVDEVEATHQAEMVSMRRQILRLKAKLVVARMRGFCG